MKDPDIIDIGNPPNSSQDKEQSAFFKPLSSRGFPRWLVYVMGLFGLAYILNPGMGMLELIPDSLPIIGNLDEGGAVLLIIYAIIEIVDWRKKK